MAPILPRMGRGTPISGDVASFRYYVEFQEEEYADGQIYRWGPDFRRELQSELDELTKRVLGSEFEVRSVSLRPGSLEVLVVIGTSYYFISRWKSFVESLDLLSNQIRGLIERFVGNRGAPIRRVEGAWNPTGGLLYVLNQKVGTSSTGPAYGFLLGYLILSHAALLGVLLWLVLAE